MIKKLAVVLMHLVMLALVCAIGAYWVIRIVTPPPASVPPPQTASVLSEPDPTLAARMFGLVQAAPVPSTIEIQALGAFVAGKDSAAVLAVDGKPPRVYLLNQEVVAGGRLVEVRSDAVTVEQGGVRRDVTLPIQPPPNMGAAPPSRGFRRDGNTLSAPTMAGGAQPALAPRQVPPRLPVPPPQPPAPQPQQVQPQAQPDQGDAGAESAERRAAKGRSLTQ
jgi:general secretion pathway protein C